MQKKFSLLFAIVLLFQTVASSLVLPVQAVAKGNDSSVFAGFTVTDDDGNVTNEEEASNGSIVNVHLDWSVQNTDAEKEYTETFAVPNADWLQIKENQSGILTDGKTEIGNYQTITGNMVKVTFTAEMDEHAEASGTIVAHASVTKEKAADEPQEKVNKDVPANEQSKNKDQQETDETATQTEPENAETNQDNLKTTAPDNEKKAENDKENNDNTNVNQDSKDETKSKAETDVKADDNEKTIDDKGSKDTLKTEDENKDKSTASEHTDEKTNSTAKEDKGIFHSFLSLFKSSDPDSKGTAIKENILKDIRVTLQDGSPLPDPMPNPSEKVLPLNIAYDFVLPNNAGYKGGSTFTFELPDVFQVYNKASGELYKGQNKFGEWELNKDGTVTITFNEKIETESDITGSIQFGTEIRKDLDGGLDQTITVPVSGEADIKIPLHFQPKKGSSIDKSGVPKKQYNAKTIEWTVDLNKDLTDIKGAQLKDPAGSNQELVKGSIKIYELEVQVDGTVKQGKDVTGDFNTTGFPVVFGDTNKAYRVIYKTKITDEDGTKYPNTATLTGDNIANLPATAEVSVTRGSSLEKAAGEYDPDTMEITWTVKYNYNEKTIDQNMAWLDDQVKSGHTFADGSVKVEEIELDDEGKEASASKYTDYTVNKTGDGFKLQFNQSINKAYKVTYQTHVTDRILDDSDFENVVTTGSGDTKGTKKEIAQTAFHKYNYADETDYVAKTTKWGISVNKDKHKMKNLVLTDKLPKGLTLNGYTITHGGQALTEGTDYTYSYDSNTGDIRFDFTNKLDPVTKEIYIKYDTTFNVNKADGKTFTNAAKIVWTPEGETTSRTKTDQATFTPNDETKYNGSKSGSYNAQTKEITWKVGVNYTSKPITNAIVEDTIQGKQNFDINSIKVYKMKINPSGTFEKDGNALIKGTDYQVAPSDSGKGFKVTLGDIKEPYVIEYTTDLKDQLIVDKYDNTAKLFDGAKHLTDLDAAVSLGDNGGKYTKKSGKQNDDDPRVMNWNVTINPTQSVMNDVTLTDKPSGNQIILKDTINVYGTHVAENGAITIDKTNKLTKGTDYTVAFKEADGKEYFEVTLLNEMKTAYMLQYDTFLMAADEDEVSNKATLDGTELTTEDTESDEKYQVRYTSGSGVIDGRLGKLEITKVDDNDPAQPLEGAEFTLYNEKGDVAFATRKTDTDGKATFDGLLFGNYVLKETGMPNGPKEYVTEIGKESPGKRVTIDKEVKDENDEGNSYTIINKEIRRHVKLTKTNQSDEKMAGVKFNLYKNDDSPVTVDGKTEFTTDADGQIYIEDLPAGEYYFKEAEKVTNYLPNDNKYSFKIEAKQTVIDKVNIVNQLIPGQGSLVKKDKETGNPLKDAVFEVRDANNDVVNTFATDENGKGITKKLQPGTYKIKELTAPTGYEKSDTEYTLVIPETDKEDQVYPINVSNDPVPNQVKTTSIQLIKQDAINNGQKLKDTEFTLTKVNSDYDLPGGSGTSELKSVSDKDGIVNFKDLKPGKYNIQETKTPDGYINSSQSVTVEVTYADVDKGTVVKIDENNKSLTIDNDPLANIIVKKEDSKTKTALNGAEFKVVNKTTNTEVRTGLMTKGSGEISITGLPAGDYQLVETKAPTGYEKDSTAQEFTVKSGAADTEIINLTFENEIIRGSVKLTKVDGDNNNAPMKDVEFKLVGTNLKNSTQDYEKTGLTTDVNGEREVSGLRPGHYEFIETKTPDGYQSYWKDITFDIAFGDTADNKVLDDIVNYKLVTIPVEKIWKDNWDKTDSGERPKTITVDLLQNNKSIETYELKSNEDWKHAFKELDAVDENGHRYTYSVQEKTPDGYTSAVTGDANGFTITNTAKTTDIQLTKKDSISGTDLDGAEFELTYPDGTATTKTTKNGALTFTDLQPGNYTLAETKAADGYIKDSTPINVTITLADVENKVIIKKDITNDPFAKVTFQKVDAETNVPLTGAEFKVVDSKGDDVPGFTNLSVKSDGTLSITGLPTGNYKLVETKAPAGYVLDNSGTAFEVKARTESEGTEDVELNKIDNEIKRGSVTFLKTDGDDNPLKDVEFKLESTSLVNSTDKYSEVHKTDNNGKMDVDNLRPGTYKFTETFPDGYQKYSNKDLTFTIDPVNGETNIDLGQVKNYKLRDIPVTKKWVDHSNEFNYRPDEIKVDLYQESKSVTKHVAKTETLTNSNADKSDANQWKYTFKDLDAVDANGDPYTYTIDEQAVNGYTTKVDGYTITNTQETIDIPVTKTWVEVDSNYRPDSITVRVKNGNDVVKTKEIKGADGNWDYTFKELPKYDKSGNEINYAVDEEAVKGYTTKIDGYTITNTQETIDIPVTKMWDEADSQYRPDAITVHVKNGDSVVKTKEIQGTGDKWDYTFTNLPKYNKNGSEIKYTAEEEKVNGYTTKVDNYVITNSQITTNITVGKIWNDNLNATNKRPDEITVQVKKGNDVVAEKKVTVNKSDEKQVIEFNDLPKYDNDGNEIAYAINELPVAGYTTEVKGNEITNTRSDKVNVEGEKTWKDTPDTADRPESITVNLYKNGQPAGKHATVKKDDNWKYAFKDLPGFDKDGKAITYSVKETKVSGYQAAYNGYDIVNIRTGVTSAEGTKTWLDGNSKDRPASITVNLLQNGKKVDSTEATADTNWTYTFQDLDKYDDQGAAYVYTVEEEPVKGYQTTQNGYDFTNLRIGKTNAEGTKTWLDDNNPDRPKEITVKLLANGKDTGKTIKATADNDWKFTFQDLDKYDDQGVEIAYSAEEEAIAGYDVSYDNDSFAITNLRTGKTNVTGEKIWKEVNQTYRPDSVTIQLLANGADTGKTVKATADTSWKYTFADLDKYDAQGKEITYTVKEEKVAGYTSEIDGTNVINTQQITKLTGTKTWLDDHNPDRPKEITVKLLANGKDTGKTVKTAAADNWNYTFDKLAKYDKKGKLINYTVDEADVPAGYQKILDVNGTDIANLRIGTTELDITKQWKDDNEADRPDTITVNLLGNGDLDSYELSKETNWELHIADLPKYDDQGKQIVYTLTEQDVPGYDAVVDGFHITNTRSESKAITITKTWLDGDSNKRPDSIDVALFRSAGDGGKELADTYQLTAKDNWSLEITDLPAFDENGQAYQYSIEETTKLAGYETTIHGFDIVNLRTGTTAAEGTKTWKNDDPGNRPDSITVNLLRNGEKIDTIDVTAADNWAYAFADLAAFDELGAAYSYTIDEEPVKGYKTTINGYDITNTFMPAAVETITPDSNKTNPAADHPKPVKDSAGAEMPNTATNIYNYLAAGAGLLIIGFMLLMIYRRRNA